MTDIVSRIIETNRISTGALFEIVINGITIQNIVIMKILAIASYGDHWVEFIRITKSKVYQ